MSLAHDMSALLEAARGQDACLETGMNCYPMAALERTMKIQEVILRAFGKEDYLVASSRDHRDHRPTDAAVALALQGVWL